MTSARAQSGFTLIEMIVSLAVFSIVITISIGALLVLISSNRQLQDEQVVLTNLTFALDSMTREIRTGIRYFCFNANNSTAGRGRIFNDTYSLDDPSILAPDEARDCTTPPNLAHRGVAFIEGGESVTGVDDGRILYYFHVPQGVGDTQPQNIFRRVGAGPSEPVIAEDIYVADAKFYVTGSEPLVSGGATDDHQPAVTIFIEAYASEEDFLADENDGSGAREFSHKIQSTIVQRTLDI